MRIKKRLMLVFLILLFSIMLSSYLYAQSCNPPAPPPAAESGGGGGGNGGGGGGGGDGGGGPSCECGGGSDNGGGCGACGSMRRDCDGCNWGGWYCAGQSSSFGQSCGNCGTIACDGSCSNQGVCSPGSAQCVNGKYQTCSSSCGWSNTGTDSDADGVDQQCQDSTCDNSFGVCDTAVSGKCVAKITDEICKDGLDNDCNGRKDAQDAYCDGTISGIVTDQDGNPIKGARISIVDENNNEIAFTFTNDLGQFSITIPFGTYKIIVSHPDYVPKVIEITLEPRSTLTVNFTGDKALVKGSTCESDCTYVGYEAIHKECDNINGCTFYDETAKQACDLAQPGWERDYNETYTIICPNGPLNKKITAQAEVTCEEENLIKITKIVVYKGQPVNMVITVCG